MRTKLILLLMIFLGSFSLNAQLFGGQIKKGKGSISALTCGSPIVSGSLYAGATASGVSVFIPYSGGNGGYYNAQSYTSTGVTGLTATNNPGSFVQGSGYVTFVITGVPTTTGTASFAVTVAGQTCTFSLTVQALTNLYPTGSVFCASGATSVIDAINPSTGRTWMDRNLGATQAAISSTDVNAYGDLYQWGRGSDGHQCRTSPTTTTLSTTDQPGNGNFILNTDSWRNPQNTNLWQGPNGINNPCPIGYRIATISELDADRLSWGSNNSSGALASPLKFSLPGTRELNTGNLLSIGVQGKYWSSTNGSKANILQIGSANASIFTDEKKGNGNSVRCIKQIVATIGALNCGNTVTAGTLSSGQAANGVTATLFYAGGNGGYFQAQSIASTGVTGLTATLSAGFLANGSGSLVYTISGIPSSSGTASFPIAIGGQLCIISIPVQALLELYPTGSVFCASGPTSIVDVTNPTTGKTWMDRNIGASQVATGSTDANAYGDLYQWGRGSDGHQCRTSPTTTTLSTTDQPGNGNFILAQNSPMDWRNPQGVNLWQGTNGINNPCPNGYRLPTISELDAERLSWSSQNSLGAFNSPLKFTLAGGRSNSNGIIFNLNSYGYYWGSTVSGNNSTAPTFFSGNAYLADYFRATGYSVRCIKETVATLGALNCGSSTTTGNLISGQAASGVSTSVPYTGGNGGYYAAQNVSSTGVTGLTATISSGLLASGAGNLVYTITGTPATSGTASFAVSVGGQSCTFNVTVVSLATLYPTGSVFCASGPTAIVDVTNPTTGKTWMDRNLGASQVATSSTDANAYGDLYQWGRRSDGHQCRTAFTTTTLSSTDQPLHGDFILSSSVPNDWRSPQNNNLWQGVNGINNPCPSGYRLPSGIEIDNERLSWLTQTSIGAYNAPLKLTASGWRTATTGSISSVGLNGLVWSSSVNGTAAWMINFKSDLTEFVTRNRGFGLSVRCIKN